MKQHVYLFIMVAIFILAFFLRFYKLDSLPFGLNQDETALGYNAYSILQTGKDEYGYTHPLYFKSFGDYKLPVYVYLTSGAIRAFGENEFAIRFWSAFLGSLTVIVVYFLMRILSEKKDIATLTALLLAINPWHLFFSRVAFEVNVANFFLVLGVLLAILALQKKRKLLGTSALLSFGLSLYSYNVTRLVAPAIVLLIVFFFWKKVKKLSLFVKLFYILVFFFISAPFITTLFSSSGFSSQSAVMIFGGQSEAGMIEFRSFFGVFPLPLFNTIFLSIWAYIANIIGFFSTMFFFISGGTGSVSVGNVGMFYLFEAPTLLVGFFTAIKSQLFFHKFFLGWFVLVLAIIGLSTGAPHATRDFTMIVPLVIISATGCMVIGKFILRQKNMLLKKTAIIIISLFVAYNLLYFAMSYLYRFPIFYAKTWRPEDKALAIYLQQVAPNYDHIVIEDQADFIYTSLLFYQKINPKDFLRQGIHQPDSLFIGLDRFGKYEFRHINWAKDFSMPRTLFVTGPTNIPAPREPDKIFTYPSRPVVVYYNKQLGRYTKDEMAYAIYKSWK